MTEIRTESNPHRNTMTIEVTVASLMSKTQKEADLYLRELIAQTLKMILDSRHSEIQKIVDEIFYSEVTKEYIVTEIRSRISAEIGLAVKDLFGEEKN